MYIIRSKYSHWKMCLQTPMGWLRKQKYIEIQRQHVKIQVCGLGTSVEEWTRCRMKMHHPETERAGRGCQCPCSWHWPFWDENSTSLISVTWEVRSLADAPMPERTGVRMWGEKRRSEWDLPPGRWEMNSSADYLQVPCSLISRWRESLPSLSFFSFP